MKIFYGIVNKKKIPLCMWIVFLAPSLLFNSTYGAQNIGISSNDLVLVTVNLQRILEQMNLVQASISKGDSTSAFEHAYISHSIIFPSFKDKLREIDKNSSERLESLLIDLPIMVKSTPSSETESKIAQIVDLLNTTTSNILSPNNLDHNSIIASTIMVLLNDSSKFYHTSNFGNTKDPNNKIDYENAIGMVDISHKLYKNISNSFGDSKKREIESFFGDLKDSLSQKPDPQRIFKLITAIQTKLNENSQSPVPTQSPVPIIENTQLNNLSDIKELSKGFGTYSGIKKGLGESTDSEKMGVRTDIDNIRIKLVDLLQQYKDGKYDKALATSRSAYLESYEGIEIPLRPINPDFTLDMEIKFAELRNMIQQHQQYAKIEAKVVEIRSGLDESERLVTGTGVIAPTLAFSTSFSIIFREGLESALIIGAILTYLEASRNGQYKKQVYIGILIAIIASIITWFVARFVIDITGASKELIEAIAGISAVIVLFWVSFWILNKVETKKWIEFVKAKVWQATTTGSVMVFAMLSFFTVYREGFETVLFYQAMFAFAENMESFVLLGLVIGLAVIISIVFVIRKLGKKLPLRVLFGLTMGIGAYMSIAFIGNAVRKFKEIGYISTTALSGRSTPLEIQ